MTDSPRTPASEQIERVARGLRASREFLNALPLNDGASQRAKDREFIGLKLIPDALIALDSLAALVALADGQQSEGL